MTLATAILTLFVIAVLTGRAPAQSGVGVADGTAVSWGITV